MFMKTMAGVLGLAIDLNAKAVFNIDNVGGGVDAALGRAADAVKATAAAQAKFTEETAPAMAEINATSKVGQAANAAGR